MLHQILFYLGITGAYIIAAALIGAGGYLAFVLGGNPLNPISKLLHFVGLLMVGAGLLLGALTYGKSIGAADCEARWKAADNLAELDKAKRELKIAQDSAAAAQAQADALQQQTDEANQKANDYEKTLVNRPVCALTVDDLARLRSIR
jgi:hypothetical protein